MSEKKFKSFNETFPHTSFALAFALIYPNPTNVKKRVMIFVSIVCLNCGMLFWFTCYVYKCVNDKDAYNLARNITIVVILVLFFYKTYCAHWHSKKFGSILVKISDDLIQGNDLDEDYRRIYEYYIKIGKMAQTCWIIIPILLSVQFPMYAGARMVYENLISDEVKRFMIHEMELKYLEEVQYEAPYFHLVFMYNFFSIIILSPNFAGFDGSFCIATNHLRLKLKVLALGVQKAFKEAKSRDELEVKLKGAIKDHQSALSFYRDLQEVYDGWLLVVFLLTSLLISLNIYQIYLSRQVDLKYTIFAISGVIHMYMPCLFCSNLMQTCDELCLDLYCADWENWPDPGIRKLLVFMITKSQQTLIFTGKGIVYFNMQLFISVLQTSYSVFTLITNT